MAASSHIFYAHRNDDVFSLLDAVGGINEKAVVLVIPAGALIFRGALNLKLLLRECERIGKTLSISTRDKAGIALARNAGIAVEELSEGEKFFEDWPTHAHSSVNSPPMPTTPPSPSISLRQSSFSRRGAVMDIVVKRKPRSPARETELSPVVPAVRPAMDIAALSEKKMPASRKRMLGALIAALIVLGGAGAIVFFVNPSATVTVYPKEELVEFEMDIAGRADVSRLQAEKAVVPLQRLRVEEQATKEFPSTGNRDVVTRARGQLTAYNSFSSAPQRIVATTRFQSENGKIFRTPVAVTIPGARIEGGKMTPGSVAVEVVADEAGEEFNIPPSRFTIPGFAGTAKEKTFYAVSQSPMTGGFKGKTRVVEKNDVAEATATLLPAERMRLTAELVKRFPPDLRFLDGALTATTVDVSVSPRAGEPGERFTLSAKTSAEALLFREDDVLGVLEPLIAQRLTAVYTALPETRTLSYTLKQHDAVLGRLVFTALIRMRMQAAVDSREIAARLAGRKISETRAYFSGESRIERADLSLWPFWARRLPADASRITVVAGKK